MTAALPVAGGAAVRSYARALLRQHPRRLLGAVGLYVAAAVTGLAGPLLLGHLVQDVQVGTTVGRVDQIALLLGAFVLLQTGLVRWSRWVSLVLAARVLADLREDFLAKVVDLPLSTVERAGSGDLLTRMTADMDTLARTVTDAVPEVVVALTSTALTVLAVVLVAPQIALGALVVLPPLAVSTRWYLRRAPAGYLRERRAWSVLTAGLAETAEAARTVEALGLVAARIARTDRDIAACYATERYTLGLRTRWFPVVDLSFVLPVVAVLVLGGYLYAGGHASLGQVTASTLYIQQLIDPLDRLLGWVDELQVGGSSLARLVGVAAVPPDRSASGEQPADQQLVARAVRFGYDQRGDVLHGVDLTVRPGERIAVVGPSGAGKSTLGRLLAGVHGPRAGTVQLGGVDLLALPLEQLRTEVALVTQEHHVFVGTLADNLHLARPGADEAALTAALQAVDAADWVAALPAGLGTVVGSGGHPLSPGQAQQLALARLVLADPHTLVLDEATAMLDPGAARHLERSLAAVLAGRTVIAIAHRLHTAHDADRVLVMDGGRIVEFGSHHELLAAGGSYAALWRSWRAEPAGPAGLASR